FFA
ncbi:hypothetical protein N499_0919B, partial [Wolbachia pipientis wVitA]